MVDLLSQLYQDYAEARESYIVTLGMNRRSSSWWMSSRTVVSELEDNRGTYGTYNGESDGLWWDLYRKAKLYEIACSGGIRAAMMWKLANV